MCLSNKKDNSQKYKSARKIAYKSASLLAIYKAHLVRVRTRQSPWQIWCWWWGSGGSKPQQSQEISQNAAWQSMSISWNSIKVAVFKATTVKEFSKQLQLCPQYPTDFDEARTVTKTFHADFSKCCTVADDAIPGIASITAIDLI